MDSSTV